MKTQINTRKQNKNGNNMKTKETLLDSGEVITTSFFIPENYREPSSSDNYMKLKQGENKIRILSSMIMGWEDWTKEEKPKPVRFRYDEKPKEPMSPDRPIKLFWAFVVWNYAESKVQIMQITQASIRRQIQKIAQDADWGNPISYDLKISRSGEELNTVYSVVPAPHSPIPAKAKEVHKTLKIDLDELFSNGDPFNPKEAKAV